MKKNKLLVVAALSFTMLLAGCNEIKAYPENKDEALVNFNEDTSYFQNDVKKIYDQIISGDSINTITLNHLIKTIAEKEIQDGFFENYDNVSNNADEKGLKQKLVEKALLTKIKSSSYSIDSYFNESKLINDLNNSYGAVKNGDGKGIIVPQDKVISNYLIRPDDTVEDILGRNYEDIYSEYKPYIEAEILPSMYKNLLTAKYICNNAFSALGRAYARKVSYIKIENITSKPEAANKLVRSYINDFINDFYALDSNNEYTDAVTSIDLDSLARIWKGFPETQAERDFPVEYTLSNEIEDEIEKITDGKNPDGTFIMKDEAIVDTDVENKYTSNNTYTLDWGYELALRSLKGKQISKSDLFTKTNGISDLPSALTDRIFSSSIASYVKPISKEVKDENGNKTKYTVNFLKPASSQNGDDISQYYFYDSSTSAYYIAVIEDYSFTSSSLKSKVTYEDDKQTIKSVSEDVAMVALDLASSSSYQSSALLDVFDSANIAKNIHDQTFYDYMESNYADLFD